MQVDVRLEGLTTATEVRSLVYDDLPICYIETLGITVLNISIKVCSSGLASIADKSD